MDVKRKRSWIKRYGWVVIVGLVGTTIVSAAGWFGYQNSRVRVADAVEAPPTVAVSQGDVVYSVTAPGISVDTGTITLTARVAGWLDEINVQPGDKVIQGQVLAQLGVRATFEAALNTARLEKVQAQQALDALVANAPEATAQAQLALVQADQALATAQQNRTALNYPRASQSRIDSLSSDYQAALQTLALAQESFDHEARKAPDDPTRINAMRGLVAAQQNKDFLLATINFLQAKPKESDIAEADANLAQAQAQDEKAHRDWERLKDGPDALQIELARATLSSAESDVATAQADLDNLELKAPMDGVILEVPGKIGQAVSPGEELVRLTDPKALEVRSTVVEEDLPQVQTGQIAQLFFDALPDDVISGIVSRLVPERASDTQAIYPIYITLNKIPDNLIPGMTVDASIVIAQKLGVLRLPRAVVHAHSDGTAEVKYLGKWPQHAEDDSRRAARRFLCRNCGWAAGG